MNKKQFKKKFLGQRWYAMMDVGEPDLTNKLSEAISWISIDGNKEEFIEEVSQWCYDSRSKTFSADIDGPTFTSASTKKEVLSRLKKAGCFNNDWDWSLLNIPLYYKDNMNEQKMQKMLSETIFEIENEEGDCISDLLGINEVMTFEDKGLLTSDKGVVFTMNDGSEFQLTIKKAK